MLGKAALFCLLVTSALFAGGKGFTDLSLDEALVRAGKENKLVFVDFYTTWCGPCKLMDRTTFKDPKVVAWLHDQAIAVKVDAEAQLELAKKYEIKNYPTMLWLKADGKQAVRHIGTLDAEEFMTNAELAQKGASPYTEILAKLETDSNNAQLRLEYISKLLGNDDKDTAFEYLKTTFADQQSGKLEMSPVLLYASMARIRTEKSKAFLAEQYDVLHKDITSGELNASLVSTYSMVAGKVPNGVSTLTIYDDLKAKGAGEADLELFHNAIYSELKGARRYAEIVAIQSLDERMTQAKERGEMFTKMGRADMAQNALFTFQLDRLEILLGLGQDQAAKALAAELLAEPGADKEPEIYNGLAWAAYSAGKCDATVLDWAKKASELAGGNNGSILDTLARVMAEVGQRDEAISLIKSAIAKETKKEGREMYYLKECLKDLTDMATKTGNG